jgi:hypothetical protein
MVALSWERAALPHGAAITRLLGVAVVGAAWFALVWVVPGIGSTFNEVGMLRIAIHGVTLWGLWLGLGSSSASPEERVRTWLAIAILLTLWLATIWVFAAGGTFVPRPPVPGRPPIPLLPIAILLPTIVALILLLRSRRVTALLDSMPSHWLVGLQAYRVLGGFFLIYYARGQIPGVFALPAGIGDVTTGLLALPAAAYVATGTAFGRRIGIAWNVLGLLDFVSAISLGAMSSPGPFQVFALDHPNTLIGTYPTVMIPAFAVPSSIVLHILSIRQLVRLGRRSTAAPSSR